MSTEPQKPLGQGLLAPLSIPDYRRLLVSNALWWQAMWMEMIVIGWLVLELTDSPWQVALVLFYGSVPRLIWGLASGAVIDRVGRRRIILISQTVNLVGSATIAALLWTEQLAFWHLCVATFIVGTAWAFDWPARRSYLPDLVGKSRTVDAMLLENFAQIFSRILGPFSGGALIDALGPKGCYTVLVGLSLTALVILTRLSAAPRPTNPRPVRYAISDIVDGFRYVRRTEAIFGAFIITVIMNNLSFPYMTLLPVFARDILGQGATGLGILGAGNGIGALIGLLIIKSIRRKVSNGVIFAFGSIIQPISLLVFANSTVFELSFGLLVCAGIGQAAFSVMQSTIVLTTASDEMRSRAMGSIVIGIGAGPPGKLEIGALAEAFGAPVALTTMSSLCAIAVLTIALLMPGLRRAREPDPVPFAADD